MDAIRYICLVAICVLQYISLGCAEFCGGDVHCYAPYTCCESRQSCCYDRDRDYSISVYKLQLWNMWYFWFIIIFVLFFCFGGCGYYRRRRLAAMAQMPQNRPTLGLRTVPTNNFAYTSPAYTAEPSTDFQPPPYTEVISQPDLYPSNKTELPPYPGTPVPPPHHPHNETGTTGGNAEDRMPSMPQPPPYSELDLAASASTSTPSPAPQPETAVNQPAAPPTQPANQ